MGVPVKRILLSTLGGAVTTFLAGWLIMGILFAGFMKEMMNGAGSCMSAEPGMVFIAIANIAMALLVSILFVKMNVSTFKSGLLNGAWITCLIIVWFDVRMFASFDFMHAKFMAFDVIGNTLIGTLGGGVVGWILGKVK